MPEALKHKRALVTGGAGGIGEAVARALAADGAHVIVADRCADEARRVANDIGGEAWVVDLLDDEQVSDAALGERMPGVDILVNNAGIQRVGPIEQFDPNDFRRIVRLMLEVPFLLVRAALPTMYDRGWGRVINVSSVHGLRASAFKSAYVSAKHGLEGFSKVTALEGAARGVTSNCVSPGYVRTPLVERQLTEQAVVHHIDESEVLSQIMLTESAIKRLVEPAEVASVVSWLASPQAAMITGTSYTIDGGWSAS